MNDDFKKVQDALMKRKKMQEDMSNQDTPQRSPSGLGEGKKEFVEGFRGAMKMDPAPQPSPEPQQDQTKPWFDKMKKMLGK